MPEQPAVGIPVARPALARAHPQDAAAVLVESEDVAAAQTLRATGIVAVAHKALGRAVEEIQAVGRSDPETLRAVLEDRAHAVVAERARVGGIVAEGGHAARARLEPIEAAAHRADPQRAGVVLVDGAHLQVRESGAIARLSVVDEPPG